MKDEATVKGFAGVVPATDKGCDGLQQIVDLLYEKRDEEYAQFQRKLIPNVEPDTVIGVRTPQLRRLAKQIAEDEMCEAFLRELPHQYFEENQLHGFIVSGMKEFDRCMEALERFLPYMDNWATCDQTSPKVFKKHRPELLSPIDRWLASEHTYTVRFGIGMLMQHFLDEDFDESHLKKVAMLRSEEYYVNMEIAWYMATALAKQWDTAICYLERGCLDKWTHNKTIQKARESYRITAEQKEYLCGLRLTNK